MIYISIQCHSLYAQQAVALTIPNVIQDRMDHIYAAVIEDQEITFHLKEHELFYLLQASKADKEEMLLLQDVLDVACYNLDGQGATELVVLCLDKKQAGDTSHESYGDAVQVYALSIKNDVLQMELKYTTAMGNQHPWCIETGKLGGGDESSTLFVGVHKDTRFYKNVINRPFFLSWQGSFFSRRWTGSYLSTNEYKDLIFADITGNGNDEVVALEQKEDGTYIVSLYQWLSFGFEQIATSKESYIAAEMIAYEKPGEQGDRPTIWVKDQEGCKIVRFGVST